MFFNYCRDTRKINPLSLCVYFETDNICEYSLIIFFSYRIYHLIFTVSNTNRLFDLNLCHSHLNMLLYTIYLYWQLNGFFFGKKFLSKVSLMLLHNIHCFIVLRCTDILILLYVFIKSKAYLHVNTQYAPRKILGLYY